MGRQGQSRVPEGTREHTFLIYDTISGEIVHGHKMILLPHGDAPAPEELERQAVEMASHATGRHASSLKALAVSHEELEPGVPYQVDPTSGRLQRLSTTSSG